MQRFGIEIRKAGDTRNLYRDIDTILHKNGLKTTEVNDSFKIQTVAHSLQKMFKVESFFSVCTIQSCANLCQICISKDRMNVYQAVHCMTWSEMLPEYRETLVAMILDDFRGVLYSEGMSVSINLKK